MSFFWLLFRVKMTLINSENVYITEKKNLIVWFRYISKYVSYAPSLLKVIILFSNLVKFRIILFQ